MKETASLIREAYLSYKRKKYSDSIALLQRLSSSTSNDPYPGFLLAVQYLMTDQFGKVQPLLRKIRLGNPDYLPFVELELFLILKSAESRELAFSAYLDALQKYPADTMIRKGVRLLREPADFIALQKKTKIHDLVKVPAPGRIRTRYTGKAAVAVNERKRARNIKRYTAWFTVIIAVLAIAGIMVFFTDFSIRRYLPFEKRGKHTGKTVSDIDLIVLDKSRYGLIERINKTKAHVFYYSSDDVLRDFNDARYRIKEGGYNDALLLVNKLLNSNASPGVKERANFLKRFIRDQEDREYSGITFGEIVKKPYLYEGILVSWEGRIANLKRRDGKLVFSLMVGYKNHDVFSGIADVYSEKDLPGVGNGDYAKVNAEYVATPDKSDRVYLILKELTSVKNAVHKGN